MVTKVMEIVYLVRGKSKEVYLLSQIIAKQRNEISKIPWKNKEDLIIQAKASFSCLYRFP